MQSSVFLIYIISLSYLYTQLYLKYHLHFLYVICLFHSIYPELTHNKHFIRHHTSQNKAHIIPKNYSILPRQTIFHTQRPISRVCQVNVTNFFHFSHVKIAETRITSWGVWYISAKLE